MWQKLDVTSYILLNEKTGHTRNYFYNLICIYLFVEEVGNNHKHLCL